MHFDQACISTIHGFCSRVLTEAELWDAFGGCQRIEGSLVVVEPMPLDALSWWGCGTSSISAWAHLCSEIGGRAWLGAELCCQQTIIDNGRCQARGAGYRCISE